MYRLGIIGMSEGNGHPYSWSAICNGYDLEAMAQCPFPAIPAYLSQQAFPENFIRNAAVTHIWCDNHNVARSVARASLIPHCVDRPDDMISHVDGLLLARDDAENHFRFAAPFLEAGLPVFIDKPLATRRSEADRILNYGADPNLVFSCTALRFAKELRILPHEFEELGTPTFVDAWVPKHWDTYAVHVIEPLVAQLSNMDSIASFETTRAEDATQLTIIWESKLVTRITSHGNRASPIGFRVEGNKDFCEKRFGDSFSAFKTAIERFLAVAFDREPNIPRSETLKVVEIIELARMCGDVSCNV
jgi:Oxidoreductase family, NAD-binding Rossmann fold